MEGPTSTVSSATPKTGWDGGRDWRGIGHATVEATAEELHERILGGDREAAALFVTRYATRIRRRIRGKLTSSVRRVFDSEEIISTLGRRLDDLVRSGRLHATSIGEMWSLVLRIVDHAVIDKAREFRRFQRGCSALAHGASGAGDAGRNGQPLSIDRDRAFALFDDPIDQRILGGLFQGRVLREIADELGVGRSAVRHRARRIRKTIGRAFFDDAGAS